MQKYKQQYLCYIQNNNYFLRNVVVGSLSMIDKSDIFGWILKDLCRVFPILLVPVEENMLLATSVNLQRFFFLKVESKDMSIELTLITSLLGRFLDLWRHKTRLNLTFDRNNSSQCSVCDFECKYMSKLREAHMTSAP